MFLWDSGLMFTEPLYLNLARNRVILFLYLIELM